MAEQRALRVAIGVGRPDADDIRVLHLVSIARHNANTKSEPTKGCHLSRLGCHAGDRTGEQSTLVTLLMSLQSAYHMAQSVAC